jgi:hypothetical protein
MLLAEIKCRRKPRPAWSAALANASRTVKYWKVLISGHQTQKEVSTALTTIGVQLKWDTIPNNTNLADAKVAVKLAQKKLNECRKEAKALRQTFLDTQIEAAALKEDTTTEKVLKRMKHREAQSACFRKLAYAMTPTGSKGGVTKVEIQDQGETVVVTEKKDVEREVMKRNRRHFNQAAGTPFTTFPLSEVGVSETKFKTTTLPDGQPVHMPADTFIETETILDLQKTTPGAIADQPAFHSRLHGGVKAGSAHPHQGDISDILLVKLGKTSTITEIKRRLASCSRSTLWTSSRPLDSQRHDLQKAGRFLINKLAIHLLK